MRKVYQTRFGKPGGNCHQAALASLLEQPLEEVPDFCNLYKSDWDDQMNRWLYERGLFSLYVSNTDIAIFQGLTDNAPCIAVVRSKITPDTLHSVIYHKGKIVHDPHPSGAHLTECEILGFDLFVAVDPAHVAKGIR